MRCSGRGRSGLRSRSALRFPPRRRPPSASSTCRSPTRTCRGSGRSSSTRRQRAKATATEQLRRALELRLTRDIRRLDYVAAVRCGRRQGFRRRAGHAADPGRRRRACRSAAASAGFERLRAGDICRPPPSGRRGRAARPQLREVYDLQETVLRVLAIALPPTVLVILAIGAIFARRASRRFETHSRRDRPHHERRASLAPADRKGAATTSKR